MAFPKFKPPATKVPSSSVLKARKKPKSPDIKRHKKRKNKKNQTIENQRAEDAIRRLENPEPFSSSVDMDQRELTSLEYELLFDRVLADNLNEMMALQEKLELEGNYEGAKAIRPASSKEEVMGLIEEIPYHDRVEMMQEEIDALSPETKEFYRKTKPEIFTGIEKFEQGKDTFNGEAFRHRNVSSSYNINDELLIPEGDEAYAASPYDFHKNENVYGKGADQIKQNLIERNTGQTEQEFGMPIVGRNAEGYTTKNIVHTHNPTDEHGRSVGAYWLGNGKRYIRGPYDSMNSKDPGSTGASYIGHENGHATTLFPTDGADMRYDVESYGEDLHRNALARQFIEETGQDPTHFVNKHRVNRTQLATGEGVHPDVGRTTWLNKDSARGGMSGLNETLNKLGLDSATRNFPLYFNNSAEMMAELAPQKYSRAYEFGPSKRNNTYEGDMKIMEQMFESPRTDTEGYIKTIYEGLDDNNQKAFRDMFYRLGENKQPNLKKALMS